MIEALLGELQQVDPACEVKAGGDGGWGRPVSWRVHSKKVWVWWWLVEQLCRQGWEPFQYESGSVPTPIGLRLKG